jgi:hypothetical protein
MAAGIPHAVAERKRKALERKHGRPFVTLRASNGETCILPACRTCGRANPPWLPACHPETEDTKS